MGSVESNRSVLSGKKFTTCESTTDYAMHWRMKTMKTTLIISSTPRLVLSLEKFSFFLECVQLLAFTCILLAYEHVPIWTAYIRPHTHQPNEPLEKLFCMFFITHRWSSVGKKFVSCSSFMTYLSRSKLPNASSPSSQDLKGSESYRNI